MTLQRFLFASLAAPAALVALYFFQAKAQERPEPEADPRRIVEARPDGTLVERTVDGKIVRTFQHPQAGTEGAVNRLGENPARPGDGRTFYVPWTVQAPDPEVQKLLGEEQAIAQQVRELTSKLQSAAADGTDQADLKKQLREKLAAIFDLQQQRRTREIGKIEERLGKLKDVLKKRDSAKDSIVDRRLETLSGGVDELGWEESFPMPNVPVPVGPNYSIPRRAPSAFGLPEPVPHDPYAAPVLAPRGGGAFAPAAPGTSSAPRQ